MCSWLNFRSACLSIQLAQGETLRCERWAELLAWACREAYQTFPCVFLGMSRLCLTCQWRVGRHICSNHGASAWTSPPALTECYQLTRQKELADCNQTIWPYGTGSISSGLLSCKCAGIVWKQIPLLRWLAAAHRHLAGRSMSFPCIVLWPFLAGALGSDFEKVWRTNCHEKPSALSLPQSPIQLSYQLCKKVSSLEEMWDGRGMNT